MAMDNTQDEMDRDEALSWLRAIADTAISGTQGSDIVGAAYTIGVQLDELMAAIRHGEKADDG